MRAWTLKTKFFPLPLATHTHIQVIKSLTSSVQLIKQVSNLESLTLAIQKIKVSLGAER